MFKKKAIKKAKKKAPAKPPKTAVKKVVRKKTLKKKSSKKPAARKAALRTTGKKTALKKSLIKKPLLVKPGPPPGAVPSVEEPASLEEAIGVITHYYSHLGVAVAQLNKGVLKVGDTIHVKGHSTDFTQSVVSMEYDHQHIDQAGAGQNIGLKVIDHAREHDIVYRVK
jgi:translation elongation factor EF-Tu-like GTPase